MSKLSDRIDRLEEQKGVAESGTAIILYRPDGICRVGNCEYPSREAAEAAHPAETYVHLPEKGAIFPVQSGQGA